MEINRRCEVGVLEVQLTGEDSPSVQGLYRYGIWKSHRLLCTGLSKTFIVTQLKLIQQSFSIILDSHCLLFTTILREVDWALKEN